MVQYQTSKRRIAFIALICLFSVSLSFADDYTTDTSILFREPLSVSDDGFYLSDYSMSLMSIGPDDTTGLKSIMLSLIGDYETEVTDYEYRNQQGTVQHSISIERDWVWILSCCLFIVIVFSVFRFFYLLFKAV